MMPTEIKPGVTPKNPNSNAATGTRKKGIHSAANAPFYEAAVNAAKTRAHRAALTAGLAPAEREDLCQEIL